MLGHRLAVELSAGHEVWITVRGSSAALPLLRRVERSRILEGVDAFHFDTVVGAVASAQPDLVINCIGLIKQHRLADDPLTTIELNARLPHRIALVCRARGIRLIHISTDCVFSGRRGGYAEGDVADAEDHYGRTKFLGEVVGSHALTLRTSIIGRELRTRYGLLEWFLDQKERVRGYRRTVFSGLTTQAFATVLLDHVIPDGSLVGLYHVSSEPIAKYDLLHLLKRAFRRDVVIDEDTQAVCDRSLDSSRFRARTGFTPPSWDTMVEALAKDDSIPYDEWK